MESQPLVARGRLTGPGCGLASRATIGFAYDAEGRLLSTTLNQSTEYYVYDGEGRRVMKQQSFTGGDTRTTVYVYDAMGNLAAEYATAAPGSPCGTQTCYVSVDHLGSTRLVTDDVGNPKRRYDYYPFGEEIPAGASGRTAEMGYQAANDGFNPKFTGQVRDVLLDGTPTGLDYFNARYYSPEQGRFISPDPGNAGADPANPQTWNGYAYVGNNPLNVTDPTGESWITALFGAFGFIAAAVTAPPTAFWWAEGIMAGGLAAGAQYNFEKAVNSGNIAAIAGMFIGGPPNTSYVPEGPGVMPGDVWGQGQRGPFVFSADEGVSGTRGGFWTTDYKGNPFWYSPKGTGTVSAEAQLKSATAPSMISVAWDCALASVTDHWGISLPVATFPIIPKKLVPPFRVIGSNTTDLLSEIGHFLPWKMRGLPPVNGLQTTNALRWLGRAVAPVAGGIVTAGEAAKIGQDAHACYARW